MRFPSPLHQQNATLWRAGRRKPLSRRPHQCDRQSKPANHLATIVATVPKDFSQITWNAAIEAECRRIIDQAIQEDLADSGDLTTLALVPADATGQADIVARQPGVVAGIPAAQLALATFDNEIKWEFTAGVTDGSAIVAGQTIATISGPARSLLSGERLALNLLGRLSGIATLTALYVAAAVGTKARIYDTRKTTPGWRHLEKYAVRCGRGHNHRLGLFDAVLIKDNHLVVGAEASGGRRFTPAGAVARAREFVSSETIVEVEVDTLDQLRQVLPAGPGIVLLDNMSVNDLRCAVVIRDELAPDVELEASGGVRLETVAAIARTGVDRISAGALTHSAPWLDIGLDWRQAPRTK